MGNILEIKNLHTYFYKDNSVIKAVEGVNLSVRRGEVLALVGESACGKTITAYSIMRLIQPPGKIAEGEIIFEGKDLLKLPGKQMKELRGDRISIIFQESLASLNPLYTVGFQISEMIRTHRRDITKKEVNSMVIELLRKTGIPNPEVRIKDYPHQLSGGQAQRVMVAMAISCNPALLIADEPTTSLDVTIQAQIMELFRQLKKETNFTLILITHNLALCSEAADRIAIMYAGKIVELAPGEEIINNMLHPYTKALFASVPQAGQYNNKEQFSVIEGVVPDPSCKPQGCYFHPRCPIKKEVCMRDNPEFIEVKEGHWVSCFLAK